MNKTPVERFSESYYLLPEVALEPYSGDKVVAAKDLHRELSLMTGHPLMRIAGGHYWLDHEWGIPGDTVAVPNDIDLESGDPALLTDRRATHRLVDDGVIEAP